MNDELISGYEIKSFSSDDHLMETLFVQVSLGDRALIIGVLYKPLNIDLSLFNPTFDTLLSRLNAERKPCYLLGDFNVNLLKADNHRGTEEFVNLLYANSFFPLIDKPTRVTTDTATLIDNVFTNAHPSSIHILPQYGSLTYPIIFQFVAS